MKRIEVAAWSRTRNTFWLPFLAGLVLLLSCAPMLRAQQVEATLLGTVTDPAGAAVPDAQIKVTNEATGISVAARSGRDGTYTVPALRPGTYTLTVEQAGFQKTVQTGIQLDVNQQARVDVVLKVGAVTTTVEVAGAATQIETSTPTVAVTIDTATVTELPLNIRRFGQLGLLMPGTVPDRGGFSTNVFGSPFSEVTYAANGARGSGNNVLIDGVDSQNLFTGGFSVQPSPDAIQEFKFQTESISAVFGKRAGSTLNLVTKSGTNEVHGTMFEFVRNNIFDARNFFNVNQIDPSTGAELPGTARPEFRRNQFGGYIGGPIKKNKMFVFGGYEALRERKGLTSVDQVPTPLMLQGNFSELLNPDPKFNPFGVTQIVDPTTCATPPAGCTPFTGNIIPQPRLDPVALKVIGYNAFPAPNAPGLVNNYIATPVRRRQDDQYMVKYDYNINEKDKLFVRFIRAVSTTFTTEQAYSTLPGFGDKIPFYGTNIALGWTHTFSPTVLNEVRLGFSRNQDVGVCEHCPRAPGFIASFGIKGPNGTTFQALAPSQEGFPSFGGFASGYTTVGDSNYRPVESNDMVEKYYDAITLLRGKHTITTGVDLDPYQSFRDQAPFSPHGQFSYGNLYSNFGFSDFLLGYPSSAGRSIRDAVNEHTGGFFAAFFQDDIRESSKLTINVGLRWEHHQFPIDRGNVGAVLFRIPGAPLFTHGNAMLVLPSFAVADFYCPQYPGLVMCSSDMKKWGFTGRTARSLWFGDNFNWAPRIGFAYRPTNSDKFVIRAGYGMFFDFPDFNIFHYGFNNPVQGESQFENFASNVVPTITTANAFTQGGILPLSQSFISINADPHFRQSYIHEWNFDIESQLAPSLALDTRYLGTSAIELTHFHFFGNQPIPSTTCLDPPACTMATDPQTKRLYPDFGFTAEGGPGANANYNSLQVQLTKRMSQGLSFIAGYTWSHQLSNNEGEEGGYADGGSGLGQNDNHPGEEYASGVNDARHRFTWGGIYQLPFGPGKRFATGTSGLVNALIGGWELAPNLELQTGFPWTAAAGQDIANTTTGSFRPDQICDPNKSAPHTVAQWFNIACFTNGTAYTPPSAGSPAVLGTYVLGEKTNPGGHPRFGNAGRSTIQGPGIFNLDFGLYKDFKLSERFKLQFRSEFFNSFNRANFNGLSTFLTSGSYGRITGAADGREIQFALKLSF